jgi:hypothetical protein
MISKVEGLDKYASASDSNSITPSKLRYLYASPVRVSDTDTDTGNM